MGIIESIMFTLYATVAVAGFAYGMYKIHAEPVLLGRKVKMEKLEREDEMSSLKLQRERLELERLRALIARETKAPVEAAAAPSASQSAPEARPVRRQAPKLAVVKPGTMLTPEVSMEPAQNAMSDEDILAAMDYKESER